jgi:Ca2+-binding RTX toxin-like protein
MAVFSASANTALDFNTAFELLFLLGNPGAANGQKSANGFTTVVGNTQMLSVGGSGFTYSGNSPIDGTMTSLTIYGDNQANLSITGLAIDYGNFVANLQANGEDAAIAQLLAGSDSVLGASLGDVLFGRAGNDVISAFGGNDRLYGDAGEDTLYGGDGDDQLFGGANDDKLQGGAGDDTLVGGGGINAQDGGGGVDTASFVDASAAMRVTLNGATSAFVHIGSFIRGTVKNIENVVGGSGDDTITGDGFANLLQGVGGNDTLSGGSGDDRLLGAGGNDDLRGGDGNDALEGGSDDDRLDGGVGADEMAGGSGDDTYVVDNAADKAIEAVGQGIDKVFSSISLSLADNVELLELTGTAAIDGIGNDGHNTLVGNAAANQLAGGAGIDSLKGGAGDDHLDGGAGADAMLGGLGNDVYVVDHAGDVIVESVGQGIDTVLSSVSYKLTSDVENLTLTGPAAINGTGNDLVNVLIGNAAANRLDGGAGKDQMIGGDGNDIYVVDHAGDSVVEAAGQGIDAVLSSVSFALPANVEKLMLTGTAAIDGTGNGVANAIVGNAAANRLSGGGGKDDLRGGAGKDVITGGHGNDLLTGGAGKDSFVFGMKAGAKHADTILDFAAADRISLDSAVFSGLDEGILNGDYFALGNAKDADDHLIFRKSKLFYDKDGSGDAKAQLIVKLDGVNSLDTDQIVIA